MRPITLVLIGAIAAATSWAVSTSAQRPVERVDESTRNEALGLIREFARANEPTKWLAANKARVTSEIASAADGIAKQAMTSNQPKLARAAALFAGLAHVQLGEGELGLLSMLDAQQVEFMLAEKPDEYATVREMALKLQKSAQSIGRNDLAFNFGVLASDSAYFRSTPEEGGKTDDDALIVALRDVAATLALARYATDHPWFERFVSLSGIVIDKAIGQYHRSQEQFEVVLKEMAPTLEQAIPTDFEFRNQTIGTRQKSIQSALTLARYSYRYGSPAVASARLAIAEQRAREDRNTELTLSLIYERYRGERRAKGSAEQLRRLRDDAWGRVYSLRSGYRSRAGRIWASYRSDEFYGEMLNDQLGEPSPSMSDAFVAVESLKARMLLDRLTVTEVREIETPQAQDLERSVLGFNKPKRDDKDPVTSELRLLSQLSGFSTLGNGQGARGDALGTLEGLYANAGVGFQKAATPASLEAIQQALEPREALLEYVVPYHPLHPAKDLWLVLITRSTVRTAHVPLDEVLGHASGFTGRMSVDGEAPVDSSALGELVLSARLAIRRSDETRARELLKTLHEILLQPLLNQGLRPQELSRLVIVPHAVLHYVPFPALVDRNGAYLISKVPVTIVPSGSVWRILQSRSSSATRFVAFANPDLKGRGIAELPFADQEVTEIAKSVPSSNREVYRRQEATKDKFLAQSGSAGLLHLSTHGEFPDENALDLHAILLAEESTNGPALRAGEVRKANLSSARLVVLSVCNGGLYRIGPADEPYGLIPAFLESGAQNVVGTLWPLDDQFGRDFMVEFYRHLATEGPAGAYRNASMRFIRDDEFIRRWAGFVVVGPGRPFGASARQ